MRGWTTSHKNDNDKNKDKPMDHLPTTLAHLRDRNQGLQATCEACHHTRGLDLQEMIFRYGSGLPVPRLKKHLKCAECGCRDVAVQVTTGEQ